VGFNVNMMCSIGSIGGGIGGDQWGSGVLILRPVAVGKNLFLWREVLVLMDRNPLLMFSSHLRSWVMVVPRERKDSKVSTGESHCWVLESIELQDVLPAPGHQMVNLPPVGRTNPHQR